MDKIKIEMTVSVEEGLKVLEALESVSVSAREQKKTIEKWPYWCWNCKMKIESPPKLDERGDMLCPSCGCAIPEP